MDIHMDIRSMKTSSDWCMPQTSWPGLGYEWQSILWWVSGIHFCVLCGIFVMKTNNFDFFESRAFRGTHTPMCSIVTQAVELWFFNSIWLQKHFQTLFGSVFQVVTYRSVEKLMPRSGAFFIRFLNENVQFEQFSEHFRNVAPLRKLACNLAIRFIFFYVNL